MTKFARALRSVCLDGQLKTGGREKNRGDESREAVRLDVHVLKCFFGSDSRI
jgi:hypothetical protein